MTSPFDVVKVSLPALNTLPSPLSPPLTDPAPIRPLPRSPSSTLNFHIYSPFFFFLFGPLTSFEIGGEFRVGRGKGSDGRSKTRGSKGVGLSFRGDRADHPVSTGIRRDLFAVSN